VKRKIAILFLSFYVLGSTECHQVLRMPLLVKHYYEHQQQVDSLTFWEFLVLHYKNDVAHDDQDMSLPFKDCHHAAATSAPAVPCQRFTFTPLSPVTTENLFSFNQEQLPTSYLGEIFQPPRI